MSIPVSAPFGFEVETLYTRQEVFGVIGISDHKGGPWFTGHTAHGEDTFIFCGIGTGGRTGHDYENHFVGDLLMWSSKGTSRLHNDSIHRMVHGSGRVYVFYRELDRAPFRFAGLATAEKTFDKTPARILWSFTDISGRDIAGAAEESSQAYSVLEGARRTVTVNVFERNPIARAKCIGHWGSSCVVCLFDYEKKYGVIGRNYIHVHHLVPLSKVGEQHELDPIADLRPVCANCHAMLHRHDPPISIDELRSLLS